MSIFNFKAGGQKDRPASVDPSPKGISTWPNNLHIEPGLRAVRYSLAETIMASPHTMIAGTTGSGKSVLVHNIIYETLTRHPYEAGLILIDLKRVELFKYSKLPFRILRYACEPETVTEALSYAVGCVRNRLDKMQKENLRQSTQGDIYIIVDELADMIQTCGREALDDLATIGRLGRCANVHFIVATQAPDRKTCPACLAQNATLRIGLRCQTAIESRQIINEAGAELLPRYGEALVLQNGYVTRHLIEMVSSERIDERIDLWEHKMTYSDSLNGKVYLDAKRNA